MHYGIVIAVLNEQCSARRQCTSSIGCETQGAVQVGGSREDGQRLEGRNCLLTTDSLLYSSSIAYILHTSGSTGVPKKVAQCK